MISSVHFSGKRQDWATPRQLIEHLRREFSFNLDVAATDETAVAPLWMRTGALDSEWKGVIWCNPPYGRAIGRWVEKAHRESRKGATVVMLLPARTDTSWWHDYVMKSAADIRFLRGRLQFDDAKRKRAPFPSAIVVFRPPPNPPE